MTKSPEAIVQNQLEAYNAKDLEGLLELYALDAEMLAFPSTLLAKGREALRERFRQRFLEPNLKAQLLNRIVSGNLVIDHERVTRDFPEGPGSVELVMLYEVAEGYIQRARVVQGRQTLD